jgi:ABC-type antimicrobial peptide transport system permease subunit
MAAVAALTLMIAAHLDTTERRNELATLVAIGASVRTILGGLLARSAAIAGAGAAVGTLAGAAVATTLGPGLQAFALSTWVLVSVVVAAAVCVGVVASAPTAFWSAARDPVRELQEG